MTLEDVLGCVLVLGWNGYLIYKWKSNDKKEEARKRDTEILGDVNDRPSKHNTTRQQIWMERRYTKPTNQLSTTYP